jgi:hypothetical protein
MKIKCIKFYNISILEITGNFQAVIQGGLIQAKPDRFPELRFQT